MHAVADYFQDAADKRGDALGVARGDASRACRAIRNCSIAASKPWAWKCPPAFSQSTAAAAVEAGVHVYMAKPVAADVPGCLAIAAAGKQATGEAASVLRRLPDSDRSVQHRGRQTYPQRRDGKTCQDGHGGCHGAHEDPPKTATLESRLHQSVWASDVALSGDWITAFDIHAIDAALLGRRPTSRRGNGPSRGSAAAIRTATPATFAKSCTNTLTACCIIIRDRRCPTVPTAS